MTGNISGPSYSGGIIGYINGSIITVNVKKCISIGNISPVVLSVIGGLLVVLAAGAVVFTKKRKKAQTISEKSADETIFTDKE